MRFPVLSARLKKLLPPVIVLATFGFFAYFVATHADIRDGLATVPASTLILLLGLYLVFFLCLTATYDATLRLCGLGLGHTENLLLSAYSSIANFFGPLQSGPGVRAVYLKQKHGVHLSDYFIATLFYYACFAVLSAALLFVNSRFWWLSPVAALGALIISAAVLYVFSRRLQRGRGKLQLRISAPLLGYLMLATLAQLAVQIIIFYVELQAVHTGASLRQATAYTGAAGFSLFVSLTPGAIGFRESFLALSRQLHHISATGIVSANVIDRGIYLLLLGLLFLLVLAFHADRRFRIKADKH